MKHFSDVISPRPERGCVRRPKAWFSLHFHRAHHFCHAAVHDRIIQFKAYDLEGRLFDPFELTKAEGR